MKPRLIHSGRDSAIYQVDLRDLAERRPTFAAAIKVYKYNAGRSSETIMQRELGALELFKKSNPIF
jgi:hypothetical protein